jgi:hypothetical protein
VDRDRLGDTPWSERVVLDSDTLQLELETAQKAIRNLLREATKAQRRYDELNRAYRMTVDNLIRTSGECHELERDRDKWKQRAEQRGLDPSLQTGSLTLSLEEIAAIRKAMARLHHPDAGGDADRMKVWNALLDTLECEAS